MLKKVLKKLEAPALVLELSSCSCREELNCSTNTISLIKEEA